MDIANHAVEDDVSVQVLPKGIANLDYMLLYLAPFVMILLIKNQINQPTAIYFIENGR